MDKKKLLEEVKKFASESWTRFKGLKTWQKLLAIAVLLAVLQGFFSVTIGFFLVACVDAPNIVGAFLKMVCGGILVGLVVLVFLLIRKKKETSPEETPRETPRDVPPPVEYPEDDTESGEFDFSDIFGSVEPSDPED